MKTLIYVPIEPLTERYTEQWYREFPISFIQGGFDVTVIDGTPLEDTVKVGTFLDINSTVNYKCSQLMQIAQLFNRGAVKDGTTFFFGDIEFWGIESIRLMADMNKVKVKLTGFLHAASYTKGDAFEIAASYQQYTEVGWLAAFDKVFVGSHYHKEAVITRRLQPLGAEHLASRIVVTGNPMFDSAYEKIDKVTCERENRVLLTNRFDSEKNPKATLELFVEAKSKHPEWEFVITTSRKTLKSNDAALESYARSLHDAGVITIRENLTKAEYHNYLATSKVMVSHSPEENFGYCIVEANHYGCETLLLAGASHLELARSPANLFKDDALSKLFWLMAHNDPAKCSESVAHFFYRPMRDILRCLYDTE